MKRRALAMCVMAVVGVAGANAFAQSAPSRVTVGVVTYSPPFSFEKDGKITGISNDILQKAAKLENFEINYVPMKFDAMIPAIQAGQIDIAVAGIFVTEERKKIVEFSNPYFVQGAIVVAPIRSLIKSIADLKGKSLACEQGSAALNVARENAEAWGVKMRIFPDAPTMQFAMKSGDVDALIYDSGIVAYTLRMEGSNPSIRAVSDVLKPTGIAFAFPKGSKMTEVVNRGLAKLDASGEITAIKKSYNMN